MNIYFIGDELLFSDVNTATIEECYNYLKNLKVIGLDIETTRKYNKYGDIEGLDPYTSKIVMLQIGDQERQYIIDTRVTDIALLLLILTDPDIVKVGHNLLFEYKHILHNYGVKLVNLYDTQIADQILYNGYPNNPYYKFIGDTKIKIGYFSLEGLIKRYLDEQINKDTRLEFLNIQSKPFTLTQIKYGADDILYPLKIKKLQEAKAIQQDLLHCIALENKFISVLGDIEYKGLNFNKKSWLKLYEKNLKIFSNKKEVLNNFVHKYFNNTDFIEKQFDLFHPPQCTIMWTSSRQVVKFFKFINACPQEISKTTKKLAYTVNATVIKSSLNTLNKNQPDHIKQFIKDYISFKEYEQSCTTFGKDFLKYINPITNRLHSNYRQIVTTGRMSSSNPNLQNIPADLEYRKCFDTPEGYKIINADYSGQETVVLANKSKEPNIIDLIKTGGDMHAFVTKAIHPELADLSDDDIKSQHKDKRQVAKAAGLNKNIDLLAFVICLLYIAICRYK